ncbi:uncharacterized protein RCC_08693 [Ramularia collo-cygni]|uniref:Uncharacterized protein n=1 Tax=Ramularia collo-cygni TaxID=112498 RepID=A0A2D3VBE3_9PEZI|nr:uncharacterized protein RCC_08693 [Ramularia collo-cygni]CZT22985.1 uncharacterized protein RCC_08693 [Ramularia collo-cygni]
MSTSGNTPGCGPLDAEQHTDKHPTCSPQQLPPHRRRSADAVERTPPTTRIYNVLSSSEKINGTRKKPHPFQRHRFQLQDGVWGNDGKKTDPNASLQTITEGFSGLRLNCKIGLKNLFAPRSSSRFDWYFKNLDRKRKRSIQKKRLRQIQGEQGEASRGAGQEGGGLEQQKDQRDMDMEVEYVEADDVASLSQGTDVSRRHSS